jgi:hypothetical protein
MGQWNNHHGILLKFTQLVYPSTFIRCLSILFSVYFLFLSSTSPDLIPTKTFEGNTLLQHSPTSLPTTPSPPPAMSSLPPPPHQHPLTTQFNFHLQIDPSTKRILASTLRNSHHHSSFARPLYYDAARWPNRTRPGAVDLDRRLHRAAAPDRNDLLVGPTYMVCGFKEPRRWGLAAWIL